MSSIKKVALLLYLFVLHTTAFAAKEKDAHDFDDTELKQLIDTIPDQTVNKKVHVLLKEGKCEEAENEIHEYFDVFAGELESHGQKEAADDLENQREDLFKKMDEYIGSGNCNDLPSSFEQLEEVVEGKASDLGAEELKQLIDTIPNMTVNKEVHVLMKEGKCKEAENEIHDYFDVFVEELKSQGQKEAANDLENQRETFFKKMDEYVEGLGNCIDVPSSFELLEEVDEGKANDLSAQQLKQLIDTIPDKPVNEKVHVLLKEGKCKEAENEIHHYFDVFVEELESNGQKEDAGSLENQRETFFKKMDEYVEGSGNCIDVPSEKKDMKDKLLEALESMAEQNKVLEDYLDELNDAN